MTNLKLFRLDKNFNLIALRTAKTLWSLGRSEYNRVMPCIFNWKDIGCRLMTATETWFTGLKTKICTLFYSFNCQLKSGILKQLTTDNLGPGCSKLATLSINISLRFKTL